MSAAEKVETESDGFTAEERAAIKERAQEVRAASRRKGTKAPVDEEPAVLAKIAEMSDDDRAMAERVHAIVRQSAPGLAPKLWYGMPAYYKAGKAVCFFQPAQKFKSRYSTLGFNDSARLDDGDIWPVAFAVSKLSAAAEKEIAELVKRAAG
jgi:uncharacterized protein YdhG (YjbR/CyaY superfamily)